jgi:glycosyltransferase involved in cell wall biosynthesis
MSNVMLHVHNVSIVGGVTGFICDMADAFPQFFHASLFVRDQETRDSLQMLNDKGVRSFHGPLRREVVRDIDPAVVILHNIGGDDVQKPWGWIRDWPTVSWHHSAVRPTVQTDLHIFVSRYLRGLYQGLIDSGYIRNWRVIPPCINEARFAGSFPSADRVIGKISTPDKRQKYPRFLLQAAKDLGCKLMIPGGGRFYGSDPDLISVATSWFGVPGFLSRMRVFLYVNETGFGPETWCRSVTEALAAGLPVVAENRGGVAEQIQDGVNGFLVDPSDYYLMKARVEQLLLDGQLAVRFGSAGRAWVKANAGLQVLRDRLSDHLLGALVGAPA